MEEKEISFSELFASNTKAKYDEANDIYIPEVCQANWNFENLDSWIITLLWNKVLQIDNDKFNYLTNAWWTAVYNDNWINLWVTNNWDYSVIQTRRNAPYYEGNYQKFEITSENFAPQTWVEKYYWYFDFQSTWIDFTKIDWIFLLSKDDKVYYKIYNTWVEKFSVDITNELINWNNFAVFACFFLWLWWAVCYPFLFKDDWKIKNIWTYTHVWKAWTFIKNPQKPITMAIRSTWWAWISRYVCSIIWTKITRDASWVTKNIYNKAQINANTSWVYYHLKTFKINKTYSRWWVVYIERLQINTSWSNDAWILMVCKNATLPWTITYANLNNSVIQANTNEEWTVIAEANIWQVIDSYNFWANWSPQFVFTNAIEKTLEITLWAWENPTYSLIYLSQSANQTVATNATFIEYR